MPDSDFVEKVQRVLAEVAGDNASEDDGRLRRRLAAQQAASQVASTLARPANQLVYGELDVKTVATVLSAAGVCSGDRFVDIGSGEGLPTLAAALLYPTRLAVSRGVEIVPRLVERSHHHHARLREWLSHHPDHACAPVELLVGDVFAAPETPVAVDAVLGESTLALCFATTWADGTPRRELPQLSKALHRQMPRGGRAILIDGRLLEGDGWRWEGDLRVVTPDTAPHSTARLYTRLDT